ncbi:MAG: hypothetical protein IJU39_07615 [Clostridia bacterium]|nr:hypothetical protein [Clostridia bacterium]
MNRENLKAFIQDGKIVFDSASQNGLSKRDVFNVAHAFGLWLKDKMARDETNISISVGTDKSEICGKIKDVFLKSFSNDRFLVYDAQVTYLPALFLMTIRQNVTGCVFISLGDKDSTVVSIEFMTRLGKMGDKEVCEFIDNLTYSNKKIDLIVPEFSLDSNLKHFAEMTRQRICQRINATDFSRPLRGLKFVIDANDGLGSFVIDKILLPLGAEVVEVKGTDLVAKHCRNVSANAGIIFDYNLQTLSYVSRDYGLLSKEAFTFLVSQLVDTGEDEDITFLTNYKVSSRTVSYASKNKKCTFEVNSAENDLIERQRFLNENGVSCPAAIYSDGRCCFSENYYLSDPVYTLFRLIMKIISLKEDGKRIDDLVSPFFQNSGEWLIKNDSFDKAGYARTVLTAFEGRCLREDRLKTEAGDGCVRCKGMDFDFEIVVENEEDLSVRINASATKTVNILLKEIYAFLKNFTSLNVDEIESVF